MLPMRYATPQNKKSALLGRLRCRSFRTPLSGWQTVVGPPENQEKTRHWALDRNAA
jgi:hypothetical protein